MNKFYKHSESISDEIQAILSLPITIINVSKEDIVQSLSETDLGPYDGLHYYLSKSVDAKIISADKDFDKVGRIDPCEI